jgi:chromosome segregation ATPase
MSRIPANLQEKWAFIGSKSFPAQCKWIMNGFWELLQPDAEKVWGWCQSFVKLDKECQISEKKGQATDLDEFWSHKFLESLGQTMTVIEMREKFRQIDADFNKRMSCVEWLMFRYNLKPIDVVNAPQGENKEEIAAAQAMVDAAQTALDDMAAKLEASRTAAAKAKAALEEATRKADEAKKKAAEAKAKAEAAKEAAVKSKAAAEASRKAAEAAKTAAEAAWFADQENKKALEELQAQEKAFQDKKKELEKTKEDTSLGTVKRNQAANQLAQLLAEDPLPLRKAKITQSATVKKSEKASQAAAEAKAKAEAEAAAAAAAAEAAAAAAVAADKAAHEAAQAAQAAEEAAKEADQAAHAAEAAARAAEDSVKEAEAKLQEALDFLQAVKKKGGIAHGDVWWLEREIIEKKKYLPASKQK